MRPPPTLLVLALLGVLCLPLAASEPPGLRVHLPIDSEFLTPGQTQTIDGQLTFEFPPEANCPSGGLPYGFTVGNTTQGVHVDIVTLNGTLAPTQVRPAENVSVPLRVEFNVSTDVLAYSTVNIRVRAITGPCGTLDEGQTTGLTGSRVAFLPRVDLTVASTTSGSWTVRADNQGNAAVRLDWAMRHPTLGRLLAGGSTNIGGPESDVRSANITLSRQAPGLDETALLQLDALVVYAGDYAWQPEERPGTSTTSVVIYEPPADPSAFERVPQYALLVAALALIVAGFAGAWWLRRRRP